MLGFFIAYFFGRVKKFVKKNNLKKLNKIKLRIQFIFNCYVQ